MVTERLPCVYIRQMDLDKRDADGQQGITQSHTGVSECGRVYQNKIGVSPCSMNSVDEFVLGVGLQVA